MQEILLRAGQVVHINGIPLELADDVMARTATDQKLFFSQSESLGDSPHHESGTEIVQ